MYGVLLLVEFIWTIMYLFIHEFEILVKCKFGTELQSAYHMTASSNTHSKWN